MMYHVLSPMPEGHARFCVQYGVTEHIAGEVSLVTYHIFHGEHASEHTAQVLWGTGFTISHQGRHVITVHLSEQRQASFDELLYMVRLLLKRDPRAVYVLAETIDRMLNT